MITGHLPTMDLHEEHLPPVKSIGIGLFPTTDHHKGDFPPVKIIIQILTTDCHGELFLLGKPTGTSMCGLTRKKPETAGWRHLTEEDLLMTTGLSADMLSEEYILMTTDHLTDMWRSEKDLGRTIKDILITQDSQDIEEMKTLK